MRKKKKNRGGILLLSFVVVVLWGRRKASDDGEDPTGSNAENVEKTTTRRPADCNACNMLSAGADGMGMVFAQN